MKNKIKVLQVIPKLDFGGAETGCYDLAHFLSEKNCKSYIVTSGGKLTKFIKKDKVKLFKLPVHSKNPIIILWNTFVISFIIIFYNITIVHARSRAPAWSCLIATKITARKFVTTFHGTYNFNNSIKKFYNSVMIKSDLIIAGSNFIFSHINQNYEKFIAEKKRKLLVIFRGINTEYFDSRKISKSKIDKLCSNWKIDRNNFIILLPGRLTNWKGQKIFIEALRLLNQKEDLKSFTAVILGSDQGRSVYKKQLIGLVEQHRLTNNVKFIDECHEMPIAYKISNLVISASIEPEAFGRVAVEAQSMCKPIIATNLGGSKETIVNEKTGILIESGNSNILADTIYKLMMMDGKTLEIMGLEGRKNVLKKFDVEKMCNSTFTEYKKLIQ